ncbi:hypothetical protein MOQ_000263 [Trypanosoma cruzi marinkellei]|uniref:Uncharacterized protein n=1 Tax=Trypanosoma cruzi marinkellei TaxID=85056 RepID=K2MW92_TRYCR|nr:hypothetical protein MOQ_000263 [Trypanosoma cruzi marinkellei]
MSADEAKDGKSPPPVEREEAAMERDENDIGLQPAPIALVLRQQWAAEALTALKEEESVGRLSLMRSYYSGFLAIVSQSIHTLHLDSIALSRVQVQEQLFTGLRRMPVSMNFKKRVGDSAASRTRQWRAVESSGGDIERGNYKESPKGFLQRFHLNSFRRMNQELVERQRQVAAFAAGELRRRAATRRQEELLSARRRSNENKCSMAKRMAVRDMRDRQRTEKCEVQQNTVQARQSSLQKSRNRQPCHSAADHKEMQLLLRERRILFDNTMKELQKVADWITERNQGECVGDTAFMASVASSIGSFLPTTLYQAPTSSCKKRNTTPIREEEYARLCGLKGTAIRSVVSLPLESSPTAASPKESIARELQQLCISPILWH